MQVAGGTGGIGLTMHMMVGRLQKLVDEQEKLGKKVNKKVMGMFERAEQEYQVPFPPSAPPAPSRGASRSVRFS